MSIILYLALYCVAWIGLAITFAVFRQYTLSAATAFLGVAWFYTEDNIGKWTLGPYCDLEAGQTIYARLAGVESIYQPRTDHSSCPGCSDYLGRVGYQYAEFDAADGAEGYIRAELIDVGGQCAKDKDGKSITFPREAPNKCVRFERVPSLKAPLFRQITEREFRYRLGNISQLVIEHRTTRDSALISRNVVATWKATTFLSRLFGEGQPTDFGGYRCPLGRSVPIEQFAVPKTRS